MTLPPTFVSAVAAVSQRSAGERSTSNQRCQLSGGTCTLAGSERQTRTDTTALAMPMNANEARQLHNDAIITDRGLPSTEPTAQPIISFASVGPRSLSATSMLTVAATCGV